MQEAKAEKFAAQRDAVFGASAPGAELPASLPLNKNSSVYVQSSSSSSAAVSTTSFSDEPASWVPIPALETAMNELQSCNTEDVAVASLKMLRAILENIVKAGSPEDDAKFRRIKFSSKSVQKNIAGVQGAWECLQACGFALVEEESEQYLVLPASVSVGCACIFFLCACLFSFLRRLVSLIAVFFCGAQRRAPSPALALDVNGNGRIDIFNCDLP